MSRDWHAEKVPGGIALGEEWSYTRRIVMINPSEKRWHDGKAFVLWFGAYGTRVHVYTDSLEDALEQAAGYLADHAPGHIMPLGSDEHTALCRGAFEDAGLVWTGEVDWSDDKQAQAMASAEDGLTYTESGHITAYEWGVALENPTTAELHAYIEGK